MPRIVPEISAHHENERPYTTYRIMIPCTGTELTPSEVVALFGLDEQRVRKDARPSPAG